MADPIPNLYKKHGGYSVLTIVAKELTARKLTLALLRRYFASTPTQKVLAINEELAAMGLGHTTSKYNPELPKLSYVGLKHAYEEVIGIIRRSLLVYGFESRDASIAIKVLDIHALS